MISNAKIGPNLQKNPIYSSGMGQVLAQLVETLGYGVIGIFH
jgi:hypothetical protein